MRRSLPVLATLVVAFAAASVEGAPPVVAAPAAPAVVVDSDTPDLTTVPQTAKTVAAGAKTVAPKLAIQKSESTALFAMPTTPRPPITSTMCKPETLKLRWPLDGNAGALWGTHNYTDVNPAGNALKDFKGATGDLAMTYDGHRGYDIVVGSFRQMDQNIVAARAAATGEVVELRDGQVDRNLSCDAGGGCGNYVALRHPNGYTTFYCHLKKSSIRVKRGDTVQAGASVGIVGSSGCSTWPHLHFEVHDCDDNVVEPGPLNMWNTPPASLEVSGVLDMAIDIMRSGIGGIGASDIANHAPPPTEMVGGAFVNIGLSMLAKAGDVVTVQVMGTGGALDTSTATITGRYGHRVGGWAAFSLPRTFNGPLYISAFINGQLKALRFIMVKKNP